MRRRWPWLAFGVPGALALCWLGGFVWFLHFAWTVTPPPPAADGIVVLTGGAERVETGLKLLAAGKAPRLLISGVGGAADFLSVVRGAGAAAYLGLGRKVTLGRDAASTRGNAREAAAWARANHLRSLIVVTAGYHMPRALADLGHAMPEVALHAAPVVPPGLARPSPGVLRLLAGEYSKWLATETEFGVLALASRGVRPDAGRGGR